MKTDKDVPFPFPKNEPININKKIMDDVNILKWIPRTVPIIKKIIINKILPSPIPKYEPTKAIYNAEYKIEIFVEKLLSKNLAFIK